MNSKEVNQHIEQVRRGTAPTITISRGYLAILIEVAYNARDTHCPNKATRDLVIAMQKMKDRGGLDG